MVKDVVVLDEGRSSVPSSFLLPPHNETCFLVLAGGCAFLGGLRFAFSAKRVDDPRENSFLLTGST
jgi:hypothetical protein